MHYNCEFSNFVDNVRPLDVKVKSVTKDTVILTVTPSDSVPDGTTYIVQTTTTTDGSLPDPNPSNSTTDTDLTVAGLGPGHGYSFVVSGNHADKTGNFTPVNQHTSMYKVYTLLCMWPVCLL